MTRNFAEPDTTSPPVPPPSLGARLSLRTKLAILAVVFGCTLAGTMWVAIWCVEVPFAAASGTFRNSSAALLDVARLRTLIQSERSIARAAIPNVQERLEELRREQQQLLPLIVVNLDERTAGSFAGNVRRLLARKNEQPGGPDLDEARTAPDAFDELDHLLDQTGIQLRLHADAATLESFRTRREVITILTLNTGLGAMVAILGLMLVRRWVLLPIADLHTAARYIAGGDLEHRVPVRSADELGKLSEQVNQMTVALAEMTRTVARQERLAATGEMMSYIAHNIRNPLAGIRALAEASRASPASDQELQERLRMIIASVDKFEQWLRSIEHSMRPLEVHTERVEPTALVESVLSVYRPMAVRRQVDVRLQSNGLLAPVSVDPRHFEQALAAILGNAIEASPPGAEVLIDIGSSADGSNGWYVSIVDHGSGIATDDQARIFEPFFTTKRSGTGMGLPLARRIVELHGGRINVTCPAGGGSVFRVEMPA